MKGNCPKCGKIIDEVEFTQFKMCVDCWELQNKKEVQVPTFKKNNKRGKQ